MFSVFICSIEVKGVYDYCKCPITADAPACKNKQTYIVDLCFNCCSGVFFYNFNVHELMTMLATGVAA